MYQVTRHTCDRTGNTVWLCALLLPYIENSRGFTPNYGERYRHGEQFSTGFVESTVNQAISKRFCKKQQMAWPPRGAHFLLRIRTRVLNGDWEATFREWYPGFRPLEQRAAA
jgi:hypothetical protein